ncbi:MAG TPA: type I glutamate--ammonia ligase [Candidatus Saccharimonadales bacterium]|nr:type I glutamate--ammonia ligase [Candidatus Saccharimonadales bacterium]
MVVVAEAVDGSEKIELAKESGIRFVQLQFTDIIGHVKAVTIPIHQMEGSVRHGTWFDGSSIEGFTRIAESDQYLMPDMSTFAEIPWQRGSGPRGTARVICDVFTPRGEPFVGDPRGVLRKQVERAKKLGYIVNTGPELEFFLFRRDEEGAIRALPHDQAGYFDFSTDLAHEVRQDMVDALEAFGIRVEASHHEVAAGQHEIDFEYSDALRTADNAITFKFALKAIAQQHGLYATFMPKPIYGINGSGMHTHQSLYSIAEQRNAFADASNKYGLSDVARSYMAGILLHARGMIAVLAPLVNSYKRLVPGYEAPTYLTWGRTNRSALIRVPMVSPGKSIEGTRAEVRCPDPSSNTYLAFAVMIAAGLDGVEKGLTLADPVEESLFEMDAAQIAAHGIKELPGTLGEAIDELEKDSVIRDALGDHVFSHFVEAKRGEWDDYRTQVTGWELDRYLDQF